jgi:hypothetical protein
VIPKTTPAFSELVGNVLVRTHRDDPWRLGFQMSLMSPGWHYLRDGAGREELYFSRDVGEQTNLAGSAEGQQEVAIYRRMLLDMLTDTPGSNEVENAYLKTFQQRLESLVAKEPIQVRLESPTRFGPLDPDRLSGSSSNRW